MYTNKTNLFVQRQFFKKLLVQLKHSLGKINRIVFKRVFNPIKWGFN